MPYSKIREHYQSSPYNKEDCVPSKCKEPKTGKCALKDIKEEHIILKHDNIEKVRRKSHKNQKKAVDCIIFKKKYNGNEKKIILLVELKTKKKFKMEEVKKKFGNSLYKIKKIFQECKNLNWEEHDTNCVLVSEHGDGQNMQISKKKRKKDKKGEKIHSFNLNGKENIILIKKCDISIDDVWY